MISEYLESLSDALSYDPWLSRCVRREVEDHLREAVAADSSGDGLEAQRRAIADFGDPHVIAAQFAVVSLSRQTRSAGTGVIVAIGAVFVAMKARVAWLAAMPWTMSDDLRAASGIALSIDRYAFWFALIAGIAGWIYIDRRRVPVAVDPACRKQLHRCFLVCMAATLALGVSVACDGVLTAFRLIGTGLSVDYLIAIVSMAFELGCAGALVLILRSARQRMPSATISLKN
jgi:HAAS domain-containing protein